VGGLAEAQRGVVVHLRAWGPRKTTGVLHHSGEVRTLTEDGHNRERGAGPMGLLSMMVVLGTEFDPECCPSARRRPFYLPYQECGP